LSSSEHYHTFQTVLIQDVSQTTIIPIVIFNDLLRILKMY